MENILLNIWIEMKSGIKVRLISKDVYNSDENYIVIAEKLFNVVSTHNVKYEHVKTYSDLKNRMGLKD